MRRITRQRVAPLNLALDLVGLQANLRLERGVAADVHQYCRPDDRDALARCVLVVERVGVAGGGHVARGAGPVATSPSPTTTSPSPTSPTSPTRTQPTSPATASPVVTSPVRQRRAGPD